MKSSQAVDELRHNLEEIRRQSRLRRLRNILKFFLIGFLIGRNSDARIPELMARNKQIIDGLFKQFADLLDTERRIKEFSNAYTIKTV